MEIANASMYDGSTGVAEAMMMAVRVTGRNGAVVAKTVHPEYREVMATYALHQEIPVTLVGLCSEWACGSGDAGCGDYGRYGLCADSVAEFLWDD